MTRFSRSFVIAIALLVPILVLAQQDGQDLGTAVTAGTVKVAIRYRYEHVDQDNIADDADASTARLRLNYRTGQWRQWSAFGEFDTVFDVILRDFNSGGGTSPSRTQYPVVADPSGSDLNQLYLDYTAADWKGRLGRQRILLDNQRFVGHVGWRQNEQTYDGLNLTTNALTNTALSYTYVNFVRRIFGDESPVGKDKVDSHLLNAKIKLNDAWSLVPYVYYLDYDEPARAANSTATAGVRAAGQIAAGDGKLSLVGELATQSDVANNPFSYDAQYFHVDALWGLSGGLSLGLGFESLGGDTAAGAAFQTPLATLHKFQGWADRFLVTPSAGIDDIYVTAKYKVADWNLTGVYHDFSAETGSTDYGSEFDLSAARGLGEHYGILIKAAFFSGDAAAFPDTTKFWIQLTANY